MNTSTPIISGVPVVVPKSVVKLFHYSQGSTLHQGMTYEETLYKLKAVFDVGRFHESFQVANELAQKRRVVLTTGVLHHRVWVELK